MKTADVSNLSPLDRLCYWVQEREAIRLRREAGESKPWTDDEILQRYRFCNVRRMDDKVSQWLLRHWYEPFHDHPNMLVACALARHFNLPSTLAATRFPEKWRPERIKSIIRRLKASGQTVFSGAYMVRGIETVDKTEMVVSRVIQPLYDNPPAIDPSSLQLSVAALLPYWGFSTFMAGQVVADLRWAMVGNWADRHNWAPLGPGSRRGMNRLHGRSIKAPLNQKTFEKELEELLLEIKPRLSFEIVKRLEAMDYQNCLCEYDKYERTLRGEGKPKRLFRGTP